MQKNEFHDVLAALTCGSKSSDIVLIAVNFNAKVGKLSASGACPAVRCVSLSQITDNGERLI